MKKSTRITYIWHRALMGLVFVVSVIGVMLNKDQSVKSEYLFNCAQSGMFIIVSLLPMFMKKLDLDVPDFVYIFFIIFCLAHFLCGEILGFFVKFKWWDSLLHTFSGMFIALLSFSLINLLNKNAGDFKLNIGFSILFAFCLTVTIGVVWEIIEYAIDAWFDTNMQRAYVSTLSGRGEAFVGTDALKDTMKDLMLDSLGGGIVCIICAIFAYKKHIKIEDLSFIKKRKKVVAASAETAAESLAENVEQPEKIVDNKETIITEDSNNKDTIIQEEKTSK